MSVDTMTDEREARRLKLAKAAAGREKLQAEVKAWSERLKARDLEERQRREAFDRETKALAQQRAKAQNAFQAAADAVRSLHQEYVSAEVRKAVSEGEAEVGQAKLRLRAAESDLAGAQATVEELRRLVKTVPAEATSRDRLRDLRAAEEGLAAPEARALEARSALEAAEARLAKSRAAYDAAMAAARAL